MYVNLINVPTLLSLLAEKDDPRFFNQPPCTPEVKSLQNTTQADYISVFLWHMFDTLRKVYFLQQAMVILFHHSEQLEPHCLIRSWHFRHICGHCSTIKSNHMSNWRWMFDGIADHNTELIYNKFHMIFSQSCILSSLHVIKSFNNCTNEMTYCGHLPMWNETCSCTSIFFQSTQTFSATVYGFDIAYFISRVRKSTFRTNTHIVKGLSKVPLTMGYGDKILHRSTIYAYASFKMLIQFGSSINRVDLDQGMLWQIAVFYW